MTIIIPREPTKEEKKEWQEAILEQPEKDKAAATEARRLGYVAISDPVFFQWQRGEKTEEEWHSAIEEVNKMYPIPGEEA